MSVVVAARSRALCAGLTAVFVVALATTAQAAPWPVFGGSEGRSSFALFERATPPLSTAWAATAAADQGVWTSPIVTQGARPIVAYGTEKPSWISGPTSRGNVHLRDLATGAAIGPVAGIDVDTGTGDKDTFGSGNKASVSFVDTSTPGGEPGQLFVVHNDESSAGDVAIAQIDLATGTLVKEVAVPNTPHFAPGGATGSGQNGSDVSGSPLVRLDSAGNGVLVFRVGLPIYNSSKTVIGKIEKVHVVPLGNARSAAAVIDTAAQRVTPDFQATTRMSPTLVTLADPSNGGQPTTYVAMGTSKPSTSSEEVRTYRLSDMAAGPRSAVLSGDVHTVSVPLTPSGVPAGAPGSGVATAPYMVVATITSYIYKLVQSGDRLVIANTKKVSGSAAPALAVTGQVGPGAPTGGHVVVTTGANVRVLSAATLASVAQFSPTSLTKGCAPCSSPPTDANTGFSITTPVVAGNTIYVARDNGTQLALSLTTAQALPAAQFTQNPLNAGSTFVRGQPAVAHGHVVFASVKGVFAYRMTPAP